MRRNNFKFFGIFLVLITIVLSLYFVWAAASAPTGLTFDQNTTTNYDKDGTFTVNWTGGGGEPEINFSVYISKDGNLFKKDFNTSLTSYSFTNTTETNYSFIIGAVNVTSSETNSSLVWMIVDTTDPSLAYVSPTPADNTGVDQDWIYVNVTASDTNNDSLLFTLSNSTGIVNQTSYTYTTTRINWTGLPKNVAYTFNVTANDSATRSTSIATRTFTLDAIAPSPSLTKKTSGQTSLILSISGAEGTCTVDRSGATISGSTLTETGLSCGKSYAYVVTCTDSAGNAGASPATSFRTTGCSSGGIVTERSKKASYSFSKITPGVATILKNFDAEIGVKEIKIEVNNEAQSVSITVTKYNDKPAAVSVGKTGKVYKYLEIQENNLAGKLDKAIVTLRVTKSWISSNGLDAGDVALFRFDDSLGVWNEMLTTHIGSEGDNELYDVELTSFSFFVISESEGGVIDEDGERRTETKETTERGNTFLLVLIIVIVLVLIGWGMKKRK